MSPFIWHGSIVVIVAVVVKVVVAVVVNVVVAVVVGSLNVSV